MSVRVGVIGAGIMGADHVKTLVRAVSGAEVTWVCDANEQRARIVADEQGVQHVTTDPGDVIGNDNVDAVLIASPDETHAPYTLMCLERRKHVLCEKPLSQSSADCLRVVEAEAKIGKRLVQVGFMRRFDPGYCEMKTLFDQGKIGKAVMIHNFHRNVSAPGNFTGPMALTSSAPHDFDITRFMTGAEFSSIKVYQPQPNGTRSAAMPVLSVLRTDKGQIATVEVNNDAHYGYEVRCELVGDEGSIRLRPYAYSELNTRLASQFPYPADWRPRFLDAYREQNASWISSLQFGVPIGASSWDGLAATLAAECGVQSLLSGQEVKIDLPEKPPLYE